MIKKYQHRLHEKEIQHLNGKELDLVRHKLGNALIDEVIGMVSFSEEETNSFQGEKERTYTTQFVIMPQSQYEHVLQMLKALSLSATSAQQQIIEQVKREIIDL
jgi:peptidyl-tRNA hydrolase